MRALADALYYVVTAMITDQSVNRSRVEQFRAWAREADALRGRPWEVPA